MGSDYTIETILKELYKISGLRICIYDTDRKEIAAYPAVISPFCSHIQQNKAGRALCHECDARAFATVKETGEPYIYQCRFGLYEAVAPLYQFGVLTGYLMMGQTLDTLAQSREQTLAAAKAYSGDHEQLACLIDRIPVISKDKILSCLTIMNICAAYITLSNKLNIDGKGLAAKARHYIARHYEDRITIDLLCQRFFCSKSTLTNAFKKAYGETINDFLTRTRLDAAGKLLDKTDVPINAIAEQCGFSDQSYFTKVFIRKYGMTPRQYRQQNLYRF